MQSHSREDASCAQREQTTATDCVKKERSSISSDIISMHSSLGKERKGSVASLSISLPSFAWLQKPPFASKNDENVQQQGENQSSFILELCWFVVTFFALDKAFFVIMLSKIIPFSKTALRCP